MLGVATAVPADTGAVTPDTGFATRVNVGLALLLLIGGAALLMAARGRRVPTFALSAADRRQRPVATCFVQFRVADVSLIPAVLRGPRRG